MLLPAEFRQWQSRERPYTPRMAQMTADAAVLAKEASNFERISGELQAVIAHVESTAGALQGQ